MKISEIITDKYKLRIPPTVYYDLLADVQEVEEEQEPKTGHWIPVDDKNDAFDCSECIAMVARKSNYCPRCGAKMVDPQEKGAE